MKVTLSTKRTRFAISNKSITARFTETPWFMIRFEPFMIRVDYKPFDELKEQNPQSLAMTTGFASTITHNR